MSCMNERYVLFVQKRILLKSFIKTLYKHNNIFNFIKNNNINNNVSKTKKFNNMINYINNKIIISDIDEILNKYYNWLYYNINIEDYNLIAPKITPKQFLSSFIFYYFPEFITTEDNIISVDIINFSKNIIEMLDNISYNNIHKFVKLINQYVNCFNQFIIYDKSIKIKELIDKWVDLEKTKRLIIIDERYEDKTDIIINMEKEQNKTIKYIKIIDNEFDTNILNNIYKMNMMIEETMVKCYFDNLEKDIISNQYTMLKNILIEIKDNIIMLHKQSEKELDEYMDVDFIIQKINNNVFPIEDFISLADYCIMWIKFLQAPVRTNNMINKWEKIKSNVDINNIVPEEYGKVYACIATKTIHFILDEIIVIKNDIINYIISSN